MDGFSTKILEVSKEVTTREKIMLKDTSNAIKLDTAIDAHGSIAITPDYYAVISIHNPKSERADYENYIIVDKDGTKYVTGSPSFWSSFMDIYNEMAGDPEEYSITAYKMDSKNYKGKQFLTCSIN